MSVLSIYLSITGTATLAKAVSFIIDTHAGGDPTKVQRVACTALSAMVFMPSVITLRVHQIVDLKCVLGMQLPVSHMVSTCSSFFLNVHVSHAVAQ